MSEKPDMNENSDEFKIVEKLSPLGRQVINIF